MIEMSRGLARQFRVLLRKSVGAADPKGPCPPIPFGSIVAWRGLLWLPVAGLLKASNVIL
jgi:hypothetical protein